MEIFLRRDAREEHDVQFPATFAILRWFPRSIFRAQQIGRDRDPCIITNYPADVARLFLTRRLPGRAFEQSELASHREESPFARRFDSERARREFAARRDDHRRAR